MNKIPWLKEVSDKKLAKKARKFESKLGRGYYTDHRGEVSARNSLYRLQLRKKPTKAEIIVGNYLYERKINFQFQRGFLIPFHRIADFYIGHLKIIVEVDGGYHKETVEKDKRKDILWANRGIKTFRVLNEEVFDGSFKSKLDLIPRNKKEQRSLSTVD